MDACIIIPARYASTRYPGKPLVPLKGASGQPRTLIERSILAARAASQGQIPIFVATDNERIAEAARGRGRHHDLAQMSQRHRARCRSHLSG